MIYSSLDSSRLDESNDYLIINIEAILAEIFRFEDFNAIALKIWDMLHDC